MIQKLKRLAMARRGCSRKRQVRLSLGFRFALEQTENICYNVCKPKIGVDKWARPVVRGSTGG
jgi:hypothetical protein